MFTKEVFSTRELKNTFLREVIKKLSIHTEEKELYFLSLEVLEEKEFNSFFEQIYSQATYNGEFVEKKKIAPFTTTLF